MALITLLVSIFEDASYSGASDSEKDSFAPPRAVGLNQIESLRS
jgi:hypothetical protein